MDNDNKALFYEEQRFRQGFIIVGFTFLNLLFGYIFYMQIFLGIPVGTRPMSDSGAILSFLLILGTTLFFYLITMETKVDKEDITVKFKPIYTKKIKISDISSYNVKKYGSLDYGGYGIRMGALNVSGNYGVELVFNNGEKLLIGSQRAEELSKAIEEAKQV